MATNHVPQPPSEGNGNMFGDGGHEPFSFNNAIFSHGQSNNANWAVDPNLQTRPPQFSPTPAPSAYAPQAWQGSPNASTPAASTTPTPHQNQYNASRGYFPGPGSNLPTPFQNNSPYAGYSLPQYQQQNTLDPSLVGPSNSGNSTFTQSLGSFSSGPPPNTISPSALYSTSNMAGNRQAFPQNNSTSGQRLMNMNPSGQMMQAIPRPSAHAYTQSQLPIQPKGTMSGYFTLANSADVAKATSSICLHNFVNISSQQYEIAVTKSSAIPPYVPRKSQNELKAMAVRDPALKEKMMKRVKKSKIVIDKGHPRIINGGVPGSKESPASSSSTPESSDYDSDFSSEDEIEVAEDPPLPATRPTAALEAVRYDTIKAVWLPRNVFTSGDKIRGSLSEFWEVMKTIRDRWRADSDAVKAATEAKKIGELPLLKERVDKQRDMLQVAVNSAIEHGHPDIMRLCGTVKPLMFVLYQFLVERIKENDYDSAFVKVNLKFLSLCTGLHNEMIKTVGLDKIFTRVAKRGDAEGKALTKKITDNAATESKKIAADSTKKDDAPKIAKPVDNKENVKKDVPLTAGVKRPAPANGVPTPAAKRTVATSSSAPAAGKGGLLKAPPTASASKPSATSLAVAKAKPHQTVTKPATNFFMGLQSASKKPGTSLASSKSVATAGAPEKKAPAKLPAAQPKFSFAETMASLTKAPEPQSTKTEVKLPPETAEQKAKRLRKEERRKLRVTWKPDAALVEIKLFSRDPSEISNNANNVRDVGDGKEKEGLMFKQHVEKDDVDVDDDDDQPMELSFFDYKTPSPINFSDMDEDSLNNNYDPYGGGRKKFESPEKLVQENREASTLMVHYMVKSDIPPCPREPADPYTGEHIETTMFGYPDNPRFLHSLSKFAPQPVVTPDVSAILANLQNFLPHGQVPVQAAPAPPPVPSDPNIALQNLLAGSFGAPQPQMASTPVPPTQEAPLVVDVNSIEAILAKLNGGAPPQAPPPMAQAPPPPPISIPGVDLSQFGTLDQNAMLAAIVNQTQQNNPYAGGVPNGTADHYDIQQYDNQQYDNQQYDQQYSSGERKRGRDDKDGSQGGSGGKKQKWNKQGSGPPKFIFECRFYKKGECRKGADCTYRHDM